MATGDILAQVADQRTVEEIKTALAKPMIQEEVQ